MACCTFKCRTWRRRSGQHAWSAKFDTLIAGKTVAVVGFGTLGQATADAARGMGLNVRAVRRNPAPHDLADEMFQPEDLVKACAQALIILSAPYRLAPATANMVGAAAFDALRGRRRRR